MLWERHYFVKKFRPGDRDGVFIWENFHPGYRDIGGKNRDPGNRASPASYERIDIFTKKRVARRDLWNWASPVDRAHMKRPSDKVFAADQVSSGAILSSLSLPRKTNKIEANTDR